LVIVITVSTLPHAGALSVMTPTGGLFPGATWTENTTKYIQSFPNSKCGQAHVGAHNWSPWNGIGRLGSSSFATDCSARSGTILHDGAAEVVEALTVESPLRMSSGAGGLNVSWDLNLSEAYGFAINGSVAPVRCPGVYENTSTNVSSGWINTTDEIYDCGAITGVGLDASAYVLDLTTNQTIRASRGAPWAFDQSAGVWNFTDKFTKTYSNPHFWSKNSTTTVYINESLGAPGSFKGQLTPEWFINGTFSSKDKYEVIVTLSGGVSVYYYSYSPGYASARLNMSAGGLNARLLPFTEW